MTSAEAFHEALNSGDFDTYRRWLAKAQQAVLVEREFTYSSGGSTTWTALITFPEVPAVGTEAA